MRSVYWLVGFCTIGMGWVALGDVTRATDTLPPAASEYDGPAGTFQTYGGGVYLWQNARLHDAVGSQSPPSLGNTATHNYAAVIDGDFSFNGGATFVHVSAPANVTERRFHSSDVGTTRNFNTELLQMDVAGGSLPAGTMLRESPTLMTAGETTIDGSGPFHISSFFDVFTELSLDGGQTWIPSTGSGHIVIGNLPEPGVVLAAPCLVMLRRSRRR